MTDTQTNVLISHI